MRTIAISNYKGGVGKIIEYGGEGVKTLSVPERATITNMGAELGATTSIFPSDEITLAFLKAQDRADDWTEILPDPDAQYDEVIDIDLCALEPMAACPHMPDKVKTTEEIGKIKVDQVAIGSCTNSSFVDMMKVAKILKGKTVCPTVSLCIAPGSKQVLNMLAMNGALGDMIGAGARILESACGPCIGMGQSPNSGGISLRTFNRNFEGRSGTKDAGIYLVSPEVAAASALTGYLTDPRDLGEAPTVEMPEHFTINDNMIEPPAGPEEAASIEVLRGPNIKPFPKTEPLPESITAKAVLKVGDNITTDHIMPAGAKILPYRSNIPHLSQFCFGVCDESFPERIKAEGKGIIIGGANYGQGSSREHAALVPLYLGVKAVITKSFARIHVANLVNAGILPFTFANEADYDRIDQMDQLELADIRTAMENNTPVVLKNLTKNEEYPVDASHLSARQRAMLLCGASSIRDVILFPTMKPLDADKKPETAEAKPAETVPAAPAAEEKIDFSNVQIEPLFQDFVDFETFSKSDFRAVKVKACEAVKKSKKLLKFVLDDGSGADRVILSGIHEYYEPEELVGKTCVAITNLPPRPMMGIDSCGMLISAVHHEEGVEKLHLLMLDAHIPAGAKMY